MTGKYETCSKCGTAYDISPFSNMCADGESAYSEIEIYGDKYNLCPRCTYEIYSLINPIVK